DAGLRVFVESLPIPKSASLMRLPHHGAAALPDLLALINATAFDASLPPEQHPFLEINLLDNGPDPMRRHQIETALAGRPVHLATLKRTLDLAVQHETDAFLIHDSYHPHG